MSLVTITESADTKPKIAIPMPTARDAAYNLRSMPQYAAAIRAAGGEPVELPLTLSAPEVRAVLAATHGVLLPGSPADVDPARYGVERDPATAPADPAREAMDYTLLDDAVRWGKPVLGICFGLQSLNTWRGGTLVQDLTPLPVNHSAGASVAVAHTALIAKESLLGTLVDAAEATENGAYWRLPINTSHHQAVGIPGEGLRVAARCPDDAVIEALEINPAMFHVEHSAANPDGTTFHVEHRTGNVFLLGVQWHPERSYDISATSRNLFHRLIAEAGRLVPTQVR